MPLCALKVIRGVMMNGPTTIGQYFGIVISSLVLFLRSCTCQRVRSCSQVDSRRSAYKTRQGLVILFHDKSRCRWQSNLVPRLPLADLISFQQPPIVCLLLATMDVLHGLHRRSTPPHMQVDGNGCGWKQVGAVLLKP